MKTSAGTHRVQRIPETPWPAVQKLKSEYEQKLRDKAEAKRYLDELHRRKGRATGEDLRALARCTFVAGERLSSGRGRGELSVGKAYLVSRMQALLQTGHLRFPQSDEARELADELLTYEIRVTADANVQAGAFRGGTHDDLATALGLAVLLPPRPHPTYKLVELGRVW